MSRASVFAAALMLLLAACAPSGFPAANAASGLAPGVPLMQRAALRADERLAFSYFPLNGWSDVYVISADGLLPLAFEPQVYESAPVWSPDGTQIVYSTSAADHALAVVNADISERRVLSGGSQSVALPRWSPDGTQVAALLFTYAGGSVTGGSLAVWTLAANAYTETTVPGVRDYVWLADGTLLVAAQQEQMLRFDVYHPVDGFVRSAGQFTLPGEGWLVALAPDGSRVAFAVSPPDALVDDLFVSALDGSEIQVVGTLWLDGAAVWSPDSTQLAYVTLDEDDITMVLYAVNADGSNTRELLLLDTGDASGEILPAAPAWSPDGTRIAIASFVGEGMAAASAIFIINADGSDLRQVSSDAGLIYDLAWQP